jgi:nucleotidyltransferase/DNA polymerase involved in DNA repair
MPAYFAHYDIEKFNATCHQLLFPQYLREAIVLYNEGAAWESGFVPRQITAVSREAAAMGISRSSTVEMAVRMGAKALHNQLELYDRVSRDLFNALCDAIGDHISDKDYIISMLERPYIDNIEMRLDGSFSDAVELTDNIRFWLEDAGFGMSGAGISYSPIMAHYAELISKGRGIKAILPWNCKSTYGLEARTIPFIGEESEKALAEAGIFKVRDIANISEQKFTRLVGHLIGRYKSRAIWHGLNGRVYPLALLDERVKPYQAVDYYI